MDLNKVDFLAASKTEQIVHISLPIVGISIVNNMLSTPREELLYISLNSVHLYTLERGMEFHVSLFVDIIQVDNQMSRSTYPITLAQRQLHRTKATTPETETQSCYCCEKCSELCESDRYFKWSKDRRKGNMHHAVTNSTPALHFCVQKDLSHVDIVYFDHIQLFISPIDLTLDTELVHEILTVYNIFNSKHQVIIFKSNKVMNLHRKDAWIHY